jgi:hypothetical protein
MKLNFWQWLGLILLVVVGALWVHQNFIAPKPAPTTAPAVAQIQNR